MLNILEVCAPKVGIDLAALGPRSPKFWHLLIEAKKLAFTDLEKYLGDPRFEDVPVAQLTSKAYADDAVLEDRPGAARRRPASRWTATAAPSTSPRPTAGATWSRSSTASTTCSGPA